MDKSLKPRILITGGCGKIGLYFAKFAADKYTVRIVDKMDWVTKRLGNLSGDQTPRSMGAHAQACLRLPVRCTQTGRPPPRMTKAQPSYTEPHIDYSDPSTRATASGRGPSMGMGSRGKGSLRLSVNLGLAPPCVHSRSTRWQRLRPPQSSAPQHDALISFLTHKGGISYIPSR